MCSSVVLECKLSISLHSRTHYRSPAANWAQLKSWNLEDTFPATGYCFVSLLEKLALFLSVERLLLPLTTRPSVAVFAYVVVVVAVCTDCSTRRRSFFFLFLFFLDKQAPLKQENSALLWTAHSPMPAGASVKENELNTREKWSFYVWR